MTKTLFGLAIGYAALAIVSVAAPGFSQAQSPPEQTGTLGEPVLLELFTSQGCSSCPPADRLSAKLAREEGLVVIARPVTYWDRLGWKDTLAREDNTSLQRDYARRGLAGYNGVYTPQLVVDGELGQVGSNERVNRRHIALARGSQSAAIRIKPAGGLGYGIGLSGTAEKPAELVLMAVSSEQSVAIGRGENGGRRISYTNVLLDEKVLTRWDGGTASVELRQDRLTTPGADAHALVLREPNGGRVLAARWLR